MNGIKHDSVFFPLELVQRARQNAVRDEWHRQQKDEIVSAAAPWQTMSDEHLWNLMFGNTLKRSLMVWSNGHCPACTQPVPMYEWKIDAWNAPWKLACPHCRELFPKNDFHRFYLSGLDRTGVFDPAHADRALLFNSGHPDRADPLHGFGVDDGEGYADGDKRWWFVGAYLVRGHWKQLLVGGVEKLAAAFTATGDSVYAHKAAILLDRIADLYPTFDWRTQGILYDQPTTTFGYVSYWCDACQEGYPLVLAYDQIFDGLQKDEELVGFLSARADRAGLRNRKRNLAEIRRNIEERLLRDMLENREKIFCNYPLMHNLIILIEAVLGWPGNRNAIYGQIGDVVQKTTAVDGVTGEKGLSDYASFTINRMASFLSLFARVDRSFLSDLMKRVPTLRRTYRFHIDTWCLQQRYYPKVGDCGYFAAPVKEYPALTITRQPGVLPSMFTFLWDLYQATGDEVYAQLMYHCNGGSVKDLPCDLFADDPAALQQELGAIVTRAGTEIRTASIDLRDWRLAILRSGAGAQERALWLAYESYGGHGHADALNLGLFAHGLDLMPDFGYPPVQFGGWSTPQIPWYRQTASHNTVVVDNRNQLGGWYSPVAGRTTFWAQTESLRAVRAAAPDAYRIMQYERTAIMVEIDAAKFYVLDIFRVVGGREHVKFMHSHFGTLSVTGLSLAPEAGFNAEMGLMRDLRMDSAAPAGWTADWKIEDRYGLLQNHADLHLRYRDFTCGAAAGTVEGWIAPGGFNKTDEAWIPRLVVRRTAAEAPLVSTFVGVIEPYEGQSAIRAIRRVDLRGRSGGVYPDNNVGVEIELSDGRRDLIVAWDAADPLYRNASMADEIIQADWDFSAMGGDIFWIRKQADGSVVRLVKSRGPQMRVGAIELHTDPHGNMLELAFENGRVRTAGASAVESIGVKKLLVNGQKLTPGA